MEGGALHAMSRALFEEVTWDARMVTSADWRTYHTFPVGYPVPVVETVLIDQPDVFKGVQIAGGLWILGASTLGLRALTGLRLPRAFMAVLR